MEDYLTFYKDKDIAILYALELNFKYRKENKRFHVTEGPGLGDEDDDTNWAVVSPSILKELQHWGELLPKSLKHLSFETIEKLYQEDREAELWDELVGTLQQITGETLRFIIHYEIPLHKMIRVTLANRGFDKDHEWVGFDRAREIWLDQTLPVQRKTKTENANEEE